MSLDPRPSRNLWWTRLILPVVAVSLAVLAWRWARPLPVLDQEQVDWLVANGDFDRARRIIQTHLSQAPNDVSAGYQLARLLLDRIATDRPQGDPTAVADAEQALRLLRLAAPEQPNRQAAARLAMYEGKAQFTRLHWRSAEAAFLHAIALDPTVPEAGWGLLNLYYLQSRPNDALELALELYNHEPDPRDRILLLLQLIQQDVIPLSTHSLVEILEPVVAADPYDLASTLALGCDLIDSSQVEEGLDVLEKAVARWPGEMTAWNAYLRGLDLVLDPDLFIERFEKLPQRLATDPRFDRWRGRLLQLKQQYPEAVEAFRRAVAREPEDLQVRYRLAQVLRHTEEASEGHEMMAQHVAARRAADETLSLYLEIEASLPQFSITPDAPRCRQLARLRALQFRFREAALWNEIASSIESSQTARGSDAPESSPRGNPGFEPLDAGDSQPSNRSGSPQPPPMTLSVR